MPPSVPAITEVPAAPGEGEAGLAAPPLDATAVAAQQDVPLQDQVYDYSGLIVLALAVAVGGGSALVLLALRRPA